MSKYQCAARRAGPFPSSKEFPVQAGYTVCIWIGWMIISFLAYVTKDLPAARTGTPNRLYIDRAGAKQTDESIEVNRWATCAESC